MSSAASRSGSFALAIPMGAFVAFGHLAGRGAVIACVASAMGVAMVSVAAGASAWGAIGLIGLVDLAALAGGHTAKRMAPVEQPADGRWMTIVVHHEAVATEATPARPPGRDDPDDCLRPDEPDPPDAPLAPARPVEPVGLSPSRDLVPRLSLGRVGIAGSR